MYAYESPTTPWQVPLVERRAVNLLSRIALFRHGRAFFIMQKSRKSMVHNPTRPYTGTFERYEVVHKLSGMIWQMELFKQIHVQV